MNPYAVATYPVVKAQPPKDFTPVRPPKPKPPPTRGKGTRSGDRVVVTKSWRDRPHIPRSARANRASDASQSSPEPKRHHASSPADPGGGAAHQVITMHTAAPKTHRTVTDAYGESQHPLLTAAGQVLPATRSSLHLLHARFTAAYILLAITLAVLGLVFGQSPVITSPLLLVGMFPALLAGISFAALLTGNDIREHSQNMLFNILASPLRALLLLNGLAVVTTGLYLGSLLFAVRGKCLLYQAAHCLLDETSGIIMCIVAGIAIIVYVVALIYYARIPGVLLNSRSK